MTKTAAQLQSEIREALNPSWEIVARLSSDKHDDPSVTLDRAALAIERAFPGTTTMKEATYPTWALLVKTHQFDAVKSFVDSWLYSNATSAPKRPVAATRPVRIPETKSSTLKIDENTSVKLEPARARTHYGEHDRGGGTPYAYRSKKADEAWIVSSVISGKILGVVEKSTGDNWVFYKFQVETAAPRWVKPLPDAKGKGDRIIELSSKIYSGESVPEAIADGIGIRP